MLEDLARNKPAAVFILGSLGSAYSGYFGSGTKTSSSFFDLKFDR